MRFLRRMLTCFGGAEDFSGDAVLMKKLRIWLMGLILDPEFSVQPGQ